MELAHYERIKAQATRCPLCQESGSAQLSGDSLQTILLHLAKHLEEISTQALPRAIELEASSSTTGLSHDEDSEGDFAHLGSWEPTGISSYDGLGNASSSLGAWGPHVIHIDADFARDSPSGTVGESATELVSHSHEFYGRGPAPDGKYYCPLEDCASPQMVLRSEYQ